jgi:hypothetical protein
MPWTLIGWVPEHSPTKVPIDYLKLRSGKVRLFQALDSLIKALFSSLWLVEKWDSCKSLDLWKRAFWNGGKQWVVYISEVALLHVKSN